MKRTSLVFAAVFALVAVMAVGPAYSADKGGVYIGVKGGYEYRDNDKKSISDRTGGDNSTNEKWKSDSGYTVGGAVGYNFAGMGLPIRTEAEYLYHNQFKFDANNATTGTFSSKTDIHTLFANVYYDIQTGTAFTPYVGAGIGVAWINQKVSSTFSQWSAANEGNYDTTTLAWNVGAGVGYSLTENVVLDLGYRYTSFGDGKKVDNGPLSWQAKDLTAHEAMLGLRYQF